MPTSLSALHLETWSPHQLVTAWSFEPSIAIPLGLSALIYLWGTLQAWRQAGVGHGIRVPYALRFLGGMLALLIAFLSPLDALSSSLFSAHMLQHQILMLVAAPLLATSGFSLALMWALPRSWAQRLGQRLNRSKFLDSAWRSLSHPLSAWILFAVAQWLWHASTLYQLALQHEAVHILEHLSFLLTAMLFWWVLFRPASQRHARYGMAIPYLFAAGVQSSILAALMTFTTRPWYSYYASRVAPWGLTPLQDQQLAGLIMWIPGNVIFSLLTIGYFAAWLRALEQRSMELPHRAALSTRHDQP